jgi:uncharacterized membrane protein YphA (DoxX/SURF4 family)
VTKRCNHSAASQLPSPSEPHDHALEPEPIENFVGWHIPAPHILAPFVSGLEFFGGIFLLVGFATRISAAALGITMIVAVFMAGLDI